MTTRRWNIPLPALSTAGLRRFARTLLGCMLSYTAARLAGLPESYWALIATLVIVTQPSLTQALGTGRDQIVGAGIGAVVGMAGIAAMVRGAQPLAVFSVGLLFLAALTAWRPTLRLACVTLVIAVLIPSGGAPFERPIHRVLEIIIGAGAALAAAYLLPDRAIRAAHERARAILDILGKLVVLYLTLPTAWRDAERLNHEYVETRQALAAAITEAGREHVLVPARPAKVHSIDKVVPLLHRLHRDTLFLGRAMQGDPALAERLLGDARWHGLADAFTRATREVAKALDSDHPDDAAAERAGSAAVEFDTAAQEMHSAAGDSAVLPFVLNLIAQDMKELVAALDAAPA